MKKEGNKRGGKKLYIEFTPQERKEVVDTVLKTGDRTRTARMFNTTVTVVNLIFGGNKR